MSAAIKASGFADLRTQLKDATAEQLTATQAYWVALPGEIADKHRHLIDEEFEVRQAVARLNHITTGGHAMSDHDLKHYQRLADINAAFRGVTAAALAMAADGTLTDSEAIAMIRAQHGQTETATTAAWNDFQGEMAPPTRGEAQR